MREVVIKGEAKLYNIIDKLTKKHLLLKYELLVLSSDFFWLCCYGYVCIRHLSHISIEISTIHAKINKLDIYSLYGETVGVHLWNIPVLSSYSFMQQ